MNVKFEDIVGLTFHKIEVRRSHRNSHGAYEQDRIKFLGKRSFLMDHMQDCCESVDIDDIVGDIKDLENTPILEAYESTNNEQKESWDESGTWTFYRIRTIKGEVTIKWYGASNGYYSESVDFEETT